jgi:hypothetical protein
VSSRDEAGEGVQDRRCLPTLSLEAPVDADLDTLVTALYVKIDDALVKDAAIWHNNKIGAPVTRSLIATSTDMA